MVLREEEILVKHGLPLNPLEGIAGQAAHLCRKNAARSKTI